MATWVETRRNLFPVPRPAAANGVIGNATASTGAGDGPAGAADQYWRSTLTSAAVPMGFDSVPNGTITSVGRKAFSAFVRSSIAHTEQAVGIASALGGASVVAQDSPALLPGIWARASVLADVVTTGPGGLRLRSIGSPSTIGATFDVAGILLEDGPSVRPFFDGATPNTPNKRYSWLGTPNASISILEINQEASNNDLEMDWLAQQGATGSTLNDRRAQLYQGDPFNYWATRSTLTPNQQFSLTDHKRKVMQTALGYTDVQVAAIDMDSLARAYWSL